jgi:tetratricopeptide (TPR) repeat protein
MSLLLYVLTMLAYAPAIRGGFIWDDDDYVENNANLRSVGGLVDIWSKPRSSPQYYPMVFTTFWVEHQLWGLSATGYHVVNVLLHATAALLLWRVLVALEIPAAFLAACLFALHPVHAESVAWITERKNVLSGVFYFAAALCYVAWASRPSVPAERQEKKSSGETPRPRWGLYALALVLFIAALLSKTVTCSLPAALLLVIWWKRGRVTRRDGITLAPLFVIGFALAMTTVWLERSHVQAVGPEWDLSPLDRILIAGRAIWFYLAKLIVPVNLSFIYPRWTIDPRDATQWAFPIGVVIALLVLWRMRDRWGRGPLVAALIFVGTLVPALGFFNIYPMRYSFVADHFQYHASAAVIVLIAVGVDGLLRPIPKAAVHAIVIAPLLLLTMFRSAVYRDVEILWRDTLAKNRHSWMVHLNLAKVLAARAKDAEATHHFQRQAELAPHLAETRWNLAINLARRGRYDEALAEYDRALERDPRFPQAFFGRGNVFRERGDFATAAAEYRRAIELKPDYAEAYFNLGVALERQNDLAGAVDAYRRAIEIRPNYALAHNALGQLLVKAKQFQPAMEHYIRAIESDPNFAEPHLNLAALLVALGRMAEARQELDEAIRLDPSLQKYVPQILGTN